MSLHTPPQPHDGGSGQSRREAPATPSTSASEHADDRASRDAARSDSGASGGAKRADDACGDGGGADIATLPAEAQISSSSSPSSSQRRSLSDDARPDAEAPLYSRAALKRRVLGMSKAAVSKALDMWPESLASFVYVRVQRWLPWLGRMLRARYAEALADLEPQIRPYSGDFCVYASMPAEGVSRDAVLDDMRAMMEREAPQWRDGFVSGAVYHGDPEHVAFTSRVVAMYSQSNPLHADVWPSCTKFEGEIVAMTARMLGGGGGDGDGDVCGTVTSGGTESIMLAMKTYRDCARAERGITRPEIVAPITAHAAFNKAAEYFGMRLVSVPVDSSSYRADVRAMRRAVTRNTVVLVGSAPQFPHGVIDPIEELSEVARRCNIGMHVDACLGGFVLPWIERLKRARSTEARDRDNDADDDDAFLDEVPHLPRFDFRLPGVTSMSADTHKFAFAPKGTSVVLYRDKALRRYQFFTITDWPGGLYFSPTFAGSRPGALIAACWASMVSMGERGYVDATRRILRTAHYLRNSIRAMPELRVLGDPLWVIAFGSAVGARLDIYRVLDSMSRKRWSLNGLHRPPCVHICVTLRHCEAGVAKRFLRDLNDSVRECVTTAAAAAAQAIDEGGGGGGGGTRGEGMAPIYGTAGTIKARGVVSDLLLAYMDMLYK